MMSSDGILGQLSMVHRGSRSQLAVAVSLLAVIPFLAFSLLAVSVLSGASWFSWGTQVAVVLAALITSATGYTMLRRYPRNIERLRGYLRDIAGGELPSEVSLVDPEDDITAIEGYLNEILSQLRRQVDELSQQLEVSERMYKTIKAQARQIVDAERHRVMIESLGTACHHIGQPATVLRLNLDLLRSEAQSKAAQESIDHCLQAAESISQILDKLRKVTDYRLVPYSTVEESQIFGVDGSILDIERADPKSAETAPEAN